ncbi:hypothetical protein VC218_16365 [Xanthomonas nasturtii]|uniref:hypothetical protein n=1 Tax=Xanthomonas nasturtii TaxID=1843581 RepID=UPI002B2315CD|nr:hypothetical protein [Xanthomonas nasturtii]MEA9580408.1 hypothetical protein [Xanthomonas nasturtii]
MKNQLLAILLSVAPTTGVLANDAVLDQALARPGQASEAPSGFIVTTNTITGGPEPKVERDKFDLKKSPNEALTSYDDIRTMIRSGVHQAQPGGGGSIYYFTTILASSSIDTPKGVKLDNGEKIEFAGTAEVIRDTWGNPFVSHVRLHTRHGIGSVVGRIKTLDLEYTFLPSPDGKLMLAIETKAKASIRFLFFLHRDFTLKSRWSSTDTPTAQATGAE